MRRLCPAARPCCALSAQLCCGTSDLVRQEGRCAAGHPFKLPAARGVDRAVPLPLQWCPAAAPLHRANPVPAASMHAYPTCAPCPAGSYVEPLAAAPLCMPFHSTARLLPLLSPVPPSTPPPLCRHRREAAGGRPPGPVRPGEPRRRGAGAVRGSLMCARCPCVTLLCCGTAPLPHAAAAYALNMLRTWLCWCCGAALRRCGRSPLLTRCMSFLRGCPARNGWRSRVSCCAACVTAALSVVPMLPSLPCRDGDLGLPVQQPVQAAAAPARAQLQGGHAPRVGRRVGGQGALLLPAAATRDGSQHRSPADAIAACEQKI